MRTIVWTIVGVYSIQAAAHTAEALLDGSLLGATVWSMGLLLMVGLGVVADRGTRSLEGATCD